MTALVTLYTVSVTLFMVVVGTNQSGCLVQKRECDGDGNCEDVLLPCDGCPAVQYRCPSGHCVDLDDVCNVTCPPGQKACPDRQCIPENSRCCEWRTYPCDASFTSTGWCSRRSGHCPTCTVFQRRCPNGECVNPGEICRAPCPRDEFECSDGSCAAGYDRCWCNAGCAGTDRLCRQRAECRKQCPEHAPYLCQTGQCVDASDQCPKCGAGLEYCDRNSSCLDLERAEFCRACPGDRQRRCRDGRCVPEREGTCRTLCWPDEYLCHDGRCVERLQACQCQYECPDGTCVRYPGECAWKMDQFPTLERLYLYIPLVVIVSGALIFLCVLNHRNQMGKRNAQKRGRRVDVPQVCHSGPSHFPIPLVALDTKPRVKISGPPPPVWRPPDIELEVRNPPPPPQPPCEEATSSEQIDETSTLLTNHC